MTEPLTGNALLFACTLEKEYDYRFKNDPDYAYSASRISSKDLAEKMTRSLIAGTASKDGAAMRSACKQLGIGYTYRAIETFLRS